MFDDEKKLAEFYSYFIVHHGAAAAAPAAGGGSITTANGHANQLTSYPNNTFLEDLNKCHRDLTYLWPQATNATTSTINLIKSCWSPLLHLVKASNTTKQPQWTTTSKITTTATTTSTTATTLKQPKVTASGHSSPSTVIDIANCASGNNDAHKNFVINNNNNQLQPTNEQQQQQQQLQLQHTLADRLPGNLGSSDVDRKKEVATIDQPAAGKPPSRRRRKQINYHMPASILRVSSTLQPDDYNCALSVLNSDIRFKLHLLLYRRIQTIWTLFSTIICLAFPIIFTNLETLIVICSCISWLFLQATGILLTRQFRRKLNQMLEKSVAQVNSYFLDHNLMLGVINVGSLLTKSRLLIPMLYFNTSHCREQIESIISIDSKKDADNKNDKRTLDYSKIGLPLVTKSNSVLTLAQSQLAKKIVLRYSQRWISQFDKRKLMFTDDRIKPRHLSTGKCLCQFIEEHFENNDTKQDKKSTPTPSSLSSSYEKHNALDTTQPANESSQNHLSETIVNSKAIYTTQCHRQASLKRRTFKIKIKKSKFLLNKNKKERKKNEPIFINVVDSSDNKLLANGQHNLFNANRYRPVSLGYRDDNIGYNTQLVAKTLPTISQRVSITDSLDGGGDSQQHYKYHGQYTKSDTPTSIGDGLDSPATTMTTNDGLLNNDTNGNNNNTNNNNNNNNNDEDLIRKLRLLLESRKNQLDGMIEYGTYGLNGTMFRQQYYH